MADIITTLKLIDGTPIYPNTKDVNIPSTIMRVDDLSKYVNLLKSININGDIGSTTITSDIATFTTANISTLNVSGVSQFEGEATFGSNVEVDGKLTLNSPSDLHFKTGDTNLNEFNDFTKEYYNTYAIARFSGAVFLHVWNISRALASFVKATKINNLFEGAKQTSENNKELDLPDFPNRITDAYTAFSFASDSNIEILKFGNFYSNGFAVFQAAGSLKKILVNDGASAKFFDDCSFLFSYCGNLVEVGSFDMNEATQLIHAFDSCYSLKSIHLKNIKHSIDISASTQFEQSDLVEIISNLNPVSTPQTLTMGSTNLAKLTQEQILVATGKGWTLA